ncbi:MAG: hypothetical protein KJN99_11400 [Marinicaulis sp.]|nr:hypothetical protein [Marinicaulis sp.]
MGEDPNKSQANRVGIPLSIGPVKTAFKAVFRPVVLEMAEAERQQLKSIFRTSRSLVEYGAGGSTRLALRFGLNVTSVESDPKWITKIRQSPEVARAETSGKLNLLYGDIGEVGPWGKPVDPERNDKWLNYVNAPWPQKTDLVLIDGRLRVACAAKAVFETGPSTTVIIHDFWPRKEYHVVLPMFDVVHEVNTMAVLKPRSDANQIAKKLLAEYRYVID